MAQKMVIVGAGIAGLSAALALRHVRTRHFELTVHEQAAQFEEVGAGIQLGPNATRVLRSLGLQEALEQKAVRPRALNIYDGPSGKRLAQMRYDTAFEARYGAPNYTIHRADLQQLLLQALGNHECLVVRSAKMDLQAVRHLQQESPTTIVAGCDGLHSVVRTVALGEEDTVDTGHVAWRWMLPMEQLPAHVCVHDTSVWWYPSAHAVGYPVRGGAWYNFVWIDERTPRSIRHGSTLPSTTDLPFTPRLAPTRWPLFARPTIDARAYTRGHTVLLGDAAHPMLPFMAQGAAMAMEDAWQLACSLSRRDFSVPQALAHYAQHRAVRNAQVVNRSARNAQVFHAGGLLRHARNAAFAALGTSLLRLEWLYGAPHPVLDN